jgi:glucose-1-phosphate thymidylyltransferase
MKGIILSGGLGTRLYPATFVTSKQLIPVYDKPMIYYPLSVLMLAGIKDILIITTGHDLKNYKKLFFDSANLGIKITYKVQKKPNGLAQAFIIGKKFIKNNDVCLILGDNIFYGNELTAYLHKSIQIVQKEKKAVVFSYPVSDPSQYAIAKLRNNKILSIKEKPKKTGSQDAIVGLYFYPNSVVNFVKSLKFSKRGELEITDLNKIYLRKNMLKIQKLGRGFTWYDAGSPENLYEISQLISIMEKRIGYKIGCLEEIALNNKWINKNNLINLLKKYKNSEYGKYLKKVF